jgi:amidase
VQPDEVIDKTISELHDLLESGELSSTRLVEMYLRRIDDIDRHGPQLKSILETNPDALDMADQMDNERTTGHVRGPLHGIPILLKDNIDTADQMMTTAGSLALVGSKPKKDAFVVHRLRQAGAVPLGKTNMSEWANFRSTHSSSGWSARGGQGLNPYALDRSPLGSSSGSASAIAANLAAASLGTETDGSILSPASANSVVGIKPTVGLTSRAGVIPISHSQDTIGSFGRTVADAAVVLAAIAGTDAEDEATELARPHVDFEFTTVLDKDGLQGARIGVARERYFGYSEKADAIVDESIGIMRELGAIIFDPANIPSANEMRTSDAEFEVLLFEFKADLNAYLSQHSGSNVHALQDLIDYNEKHAADEMPFFGQEILLMAQKKGDLREQEYLKAIETTRRLSRAEGIDAVMEEFQLDALVAPTTGPPGKIDLITGDHVLGGSAGPAAQAGYPAISVPAGYAFGLPVGLSFTGRAFSEPVLIRLAYAFEQAAKIRKAPEFVSRS